MTEQESGPCADAASKWRACLKTFDYSPDRDYGECFQERETFYSCIRDYRSSRGLSPETESIAAIPRKCEDINMDFHNCMKIYAFNVDRCRIHMDKLRSCFEKYAK
ncbi:hypothetical protein XU18_2589 [Perkinsela sp. CCAP 1560/4]|nr:hypothetical protein XU18_2589 [Perkinsela sp. CCAP 1560/4]|eukprot:KNH06568.1 hypothetical protein XU18_2589 [Perkinsela sp. CCAP 1560/4]